MATEKSPEGKPIPIEWVQAAMDRLVLEGELDINPKTVGYRSAFIGAVLLTLPATGQIRTSSVATLPMLCNKNVQDERTRRGYGRSMSITPHIVVQDAERAAAFYCEAFGAEELSRIPTPDGRLMSVQLRIGDGLLHIADEFPEMGVLAPPSIGGTPVVLALDVADAEAVLAQALAAGGEVRQALADMFWGDRHGQIDDPFGHRWNISQHLRDVPQDEIVAGAAQAFA